MNGLDLVQTILAGQAADRLPLLPILHSALATYSGVPLGRYLTDANVMAQVTIAGARQLRLDGVQLSLGVTAEAEALGAKVAQPPDGPSQLRSIILPGLDPTPLAKLDACAEGRLPLFFNAVRQVVQRIGCDTFVLATLRGPLLMASQLHGVQELLIDLLEQPTQVERLLDFSTRTALTLGRWLLASGAHGLVLGEATCSPSFISPDIYRSLVQPRHRELVAGLHALGWQTVGLHICGNIVPIIPDIIATGVDFYDVDYQVTVAQALELTGGRCALRGNLNPSEDVFFAAPEQVTDRMHALRAQALGTRWILSTGCDIPPGTPQANLAALSAAALD
ncbi:MAG: uroporphyrinogen decarboxylase family protein [Anaerolineae bacterium]